MYGRRVTENPWSAEGVPRRELGDPRTLRALAHPLRLKIMDQLVVHGPCTASELAQRLGESAANCSWHLRQLAKHRFVEEAEGGTGRRRPWRFVHQSIGIEDSADAEAQPELAQAQEALVELAVGRAVEAWREWHGQQGAESEEWRQAAFTRTSSNIWLTEDELREFRNALSEVVERHLARHVARLDPARRPQGSRPIHFAAWGVPIGPATEQSPAVGEQDGTGKQDGPGDDDPAGGR